MHDPGPQWTAFGQVHPDGSQTTFVPIIIASVDPDTRRQRYVYGWARSVISAMDRSVEADNVLGDVFGDPEFTTTIVWAAPYTITEVYPTADDWTRAREIGQAARPDVTFADPLQLTAGS